MKRKTCKYTHRVRERVKEWTGYWQKKGQNVLCASYSTWTYKLDSEMRRNAIHNTRFCNLSVATSGAIVEINVNSFCSLFFFFLFTFQTDLELCISVATLLMSKLIHVIWVNKKKKKKKIKCLAFMCNQIHIKWFFSLTFSVMAC